MTKIIEVQDPGFVTIDGQSVSIGDKINLCYIDPMGNVWEEEFEEGEYEVVFQLGAICIDGRDSTPIREYLKVEYGEYISNYGKEKIYTNVLLCRLAK